MIHDELESLIGPAATMIRDAGFVLVPRKWRQSTLSALDARRIIDPALIDQNVKSGIHRQKSALSVPRDSRQ